MIDQPANGSLFLPRRLMRRSNREPDNPFLYASIANAESMFHVPPSLMLVSNSRPRTWRLRDAVPHSPHSCIMFAAPTRHEKRVLLTFPDYAADSAACKIVRHESFQETFSSHLPCPVGRQSCFRKWSGRWCNFGRHI